MGQGGGGARDLDEAAGRSLRKTARTRYNLVLLANTPDFLLMGHNRVGRLPRTHRWREVVGLLDLPSASVPAIAAAAVEAAENRLRTLASDKTLAYAFWTLARVTSAARQESFLDELRWLGIRDWREPSALGLISGTVQHVRDQVSEVERRNDFGEIAALAVASSLTETVGREGPGLFSSTTEDAQRAFRAYSTPAKFGELARVFFADFISRSLKSFLDRELSNHVGSGKAVRSVEDSKDFLNALELHTRQAARIVEDFSGGWYSLHNWESSGDISLEEAQRFVAQALRKLRAELKQGADAA